MSDAFEVKLASGVLRALESGPPRGIAVSAAFAIYEFINGPLRADPWRVPKPLHDELDGFRGARRGEYRIVFRIDDGNRAIHVVRVDHRADVYRPS